MRDYVINESLIKMTEELLIEASVLSNDYYKNLFTELMNGLLKFIPQNKINELRTILSKIDDKEIIDNFIKYLKKLNKINNQKTLMKEYLKIMKNLDINTMKNFFPIVEIEKIFPEGKFNFKEFKEYLKIRMEVNDLIAFLRIITPKKWQQQNTLAFKSQRNKDIYNGLILTYPEYNNYINEYFKNVVQMPQNEKKNEAIINLKKLMSEIPQHKKLLNNPTIDDQTKAKFKAFFNKFKTITKESLDGEEMLKKLRAITIRTITSASEDKKLKQIATNKKNYKNGFKAIPKEVAGEIKGFNPDNYYYVEINNKNIKENIDEIIKYEATQMQNCTFNNYLKAIKQGTMQLISIRRKKDHLPLIHMDERNEEMGECKATGNKKASTRILIDLQIEMAKYLFGEKAKNNQDVKQLKKLKPFFEAFPKYQNKNVQDVEKFEEGGTIIWKFSILKNKKTLTGVLNEKTKKELIAPTEGQIQIFAGENKTQTESKKLKTIKFKALLENSFVRK